MKALVILILLAIVLSLGFGLYYLTRDSLGSTRLLKALRIRIALSVSLILLLVLSYYMGWLAA